MDTLSIITAIILGLGGLLVCGYLLFVLFGPTWRSLQATRELLRFRSAAKQLDAVDALIAEKRLLDGLRMLRRLFILDIVDKQELIEVLKEHNQNILSRCLVIAEELSTRADNIADVERLLMERVELIVLYVRAVESYTSLRSRREKAGKEIPAWSKSEFDVRVKEIKKELGKNHTAATQAIDALFRRIESSRSENIVYH